MKLGSHDHTYDDHPHLEESAADNNKAILSLENLSAIEEEHFDLEQHQRPNNMESYCQEHLYHPLKNSPLEDIMKFSLDTKSDKIFRAHPEEYIHIKKYQELLQKLKKVKDMNYSLQIQLEVRKEKIVELKKKFIKEVVGSKPWKIATSIVMDEMLIKSTLEYDVADQLVRGYDTLKPSSDELATHALVFALVEVKTRWKHVIAYHFTGSSFNKKDAALALKEIAIAAHKSGLIVTHITSDMGPCNQVYCLGASRDQIYTYPGYFVVVLLPVVTLLQSKNGSVSTPALNPHLNNSDGEDNQSSSSSSSPYVDSEDQGGIHTRKVYPYDFIHVLITSSSSFDEKRLLGIAEENKGDFIGEYDHLAVTERDILAIKSSLNGYKCHVYTSSTLANLYFSPNTKTGTIRPNRWKLMYTGIPVLVLDAGETKSRHKRLDILVKKNSHTLYYSKDHSLRVGLSFDNERDANDFYTRVCSLTENPRNIALSSPASKKSLSAIDTAHYFNRYNQKRKPNKALISSPCGFNHVVSVHREDVDRYFSLQSLVNNLSIGSNVEKMTLPCQRISTTELLEKRGQLLNVQTLSYLSMYQKVIDEKEIIHYS
ncbi:unnamed protein product [Lepeophtheirus salmonis]|uniref:(salmon louse) hypothetical protein n=1 Tax=Lepeophtheirus salmonis TaxID=72036 RepID=A0A7R8CZK8_LEPSM|nr:unnamed protein product [Lepeophtheirus salmonis]CAF2951256.1 unnamed protein product [Lepeophtheirus salmonis]